MAWTTSDWRDCLLFRVTSAGNTFRSANSASLNKASKPGLDNPFWAAGNLVPKRNQLPAASSSNKRTAAPANVSWNFLERRGRGEADPETAVSEAGAAGEMLTPAGVTGFSV